MSPITIYHNPSCSKSREALAYLEAKGHEPRVIDYIKNPLGTDELRQLVRQLGVAPSSLIRTQDFDRLGLQSTSDPDEQISLIAQYPVLLQRPIVVVGDRARIARSVDAIDGLLSASN